MPPSEKARHEGAFAGESLLARALRTVDWSSTSLGPPEAWSERLRSAVARLLAVADTAPCAGAEGELQGGEKKFQALIESNVDFIWEVDTQGRYTYCSPQMRRLWGLEPSSMLGKTPFDAMPAEQRESAREVFAGLARTPAPFHSLESTSYDAQGRLINIETSGVPFFGKGGEWLGYRGISRDVTAHKQAVEALRRHEDFAAFALSTAAMGAWDLDLAYLTARRSPEHDRIFGYDQPLPKWTYQDLLAHIVPEDREAVDREFRRATETDSDWSFECRIRRADGEIRWIWAAGRPRTEGGRARTMAGVVQDITLRRRAEDRIATLARLYEILSRANEAIVRTHDESSLYQQICQIVAEVGGFPLVWVGLVDDLSVVPVARAGEASKYLDEIAVTVAGAFGQGPTGTAIREGRAVVNDDFAINPQTEPWRAPAVKHGFRASAAFPLRRHGNAVGAVTLYAAEPRLFDAEHVRLLEALCADLSYALDALSHERQRAQAQSALRASEHSLKEADQRKNQFLATLSHELRNPLTPIRNSLYILKKATPGGEQARRAQDVIERQVNQLCRLVDDLLDVTRITRGKIELTRGPVQLNTLVRRTVDDHRSLFESASIAVELEVPAQPVWVLADGNRLAQVLGNLLQNAAKFTPRGGRVAVALAQAEASQAAVVSVIDNGTGMSATTLAHLFEPFMQADATLDRSRGGLGLGLALAKGLVEQHGGTIDAHSAGIGQGSTITVRLPLNDRASAETTVPLPPRRGSRRRVLVVDDNSDAADSLRQVLEIQGHTVAIAYNGIDGIAKARELIPDLVLCDIGLPLMDGYEIARRIRAEPQLRAACLVALSGYALPADIERSRSAGFDHHIAKPLGLDTLVTLLDGVLDPE